MLELDAGEPELGEGPPGDDPGDFAADPLPAPPGSDPVADPGGRVVAVDREYRAVRHQPIGRAVDSMPGGVRPVAPVGAAGAPGTSRLDIYHGRGWTPPHHLGV